MSFMINAEPTHGPVPDHCKSVELGKTPCPEYLRRDLWCSYCQSRWSSAEDWHERFRLRPLADWEHVGTLVDATEVESPKVVLSNQAERLAEVADLYLADRRLAHTPEAARIDPLPSQGGYSAQAEAYADAAGYARTHAVWGDLCKAYDEGIEERMKDMGYPLREIRHPGIAHLEYILKNVTESYGLAQIYDIGQLRATIAELCRCQITVLQQAPQQYWASTHSTEGAQNHV